jgi:transcriptional regulator with XRE-family HTH domain
VLIFLNLYDKIGKKLGDKMKIECKITKKHEFKDRLKDAMTRLNVSQSVLVQLTNIPKSAMSQYLSGAFVPKQERLSALAQALNVQEAWLMGYDVPMSRDAKIAIYNEESGPYDDENPWILKICEIMESSDIDTQIAICQKADSMAQGHQNDGIKEKLLALYDKIEDKEGLIRFIERLSALSVEQQKFVFENLLQGQ